MNADFKLNNHTVHLWQVFLPDFVDEETPYFDLLSQDEKDRANRFYFPIHRTRFILARGILRKLLSGYLKLDPMQIEFKYGTRGKPYLLENAIDLQFNISHSEDAAVYALTAQAQIGVDIQKIEEKYQDGIAKRFFSKQEFLNLSELPVSKRNQAFYRLWSAKEALLKAIGEGLFVPLDDFTVDFNLDSQWVALYVTGQAEQFYLKNFTTYPNYESAFSIANSVNQISHWEWKKEGPRLIS